MNSSAQQMWGTSVALSLSPNKQINVFSNPAGRFPILIERC